VNRKSQRSFVDIGTPLATPYRISSPLSLVRKLTHIAMVYVVIVRARIRAVAVRFDMMLPSAAQRSSGFDDTSGEHGGQNSYGARHLILFDRALEIPFEGLALRLELVLFQSLVVFRKTEVK
jgi:hypothetical protein